MARIKSTEYGTRVWLSSSDTYSWATRPGAYWPRSQLRGRRVYAEFDSRGDLIDMAVDGGKGERDVDGNEFSACLSDFIGAKFPNHPAVR